MDPAVGGGDSKPYASDCLYGATRASLAPGEVSTLTRARDRLRRLNHRASTAAPATDVSTTTRILTDVLQNPFATRDVAAGGEGCDGAGGGRDGDGGGGEGNTTCRTCTPRALLSEVAVAVDTACLTAEVASGRTPTWTLTDAELIDLMKTEDRLTLAKVANLSKKLACAVAPKSDTEPETTNETTKQLELQAAGVGASGGTGIGGGTRGHDGGGEPGLRGGTLGLGGGGGGKAGLGGGGGRGGGKPGLGAIGGGKSGLGGGGSSGGGTRGLGG